MKLEIDKTKAKELYPDAPVWLKEQLEEAFGEGCFHKIEFTDIKTFEDACKVTEEDPNDPRFSTGTADDIAYQKAKVITRAINIDWTPDWNNSNQKKWWPWFRLSSGFGFDNSIFINTATYSAVGSRLCFESKEKSDYAAQQFTPIYKDLLT